MKKTGDKQTAATSDFCRMLRPIGRIFDYEGWNVWGSWPIDGPDGKVHVFFNRWRGEHRDGYLVTSPFLFAHPNGRFWLYYKGRNPRTDNRRKYGLAIADRIEGPFRKHPENPIIDFEESENGVEDAFVYVEDGTFHMLLHAMGVIRCVCGRPAVGLHLESRDGIHWEKPSLAYKHNFEYFKDERCERLEKPMCLMRKGRPAYLYLASSGGKRGKSSTVLMRVAEREDEA